MEQIDSSPPPPNTRKRAAPEDDSPEKKPLNLKGTQFIMPTPPDTDQSSNASPPCNNAITVRETSPTPSTSTLSSVDVESPNPLQSSNTVIDFTPSAPKASDSGPPPAKRRKLTPSEKLQQAREKEAKATEKAAEKARKDQEKAEQKARKDEENRIKDEQKRVKDEEKKRKVEEKAEGTRKKAEEREAKKREKELEEDRKQQEKLKKERSQMRLGAFFQKPATPAKPGADGEDDFVKTRRKSLSLEPFDAVADQIRASVSPSKKEPTAPTIEKDTPAKPVVSDYRQYFLPFQLKPDTVMAPILASEDLGQGQEAFDHDVNDPSIGEKYDLGIVDSYASLERQFAQDRQTCRGHSLPSMKRLVDQIQGSLQQPIDLTTDEPIVNPMDALESVTRRYLEFHQDVRPAYFGTYTKIRSPRASKKLRRNPFSRVRSDTDYDYDSEAEWEEPEEGEDLLDDEEDELESNGDAKEMDDFLDDEEDTLKSKRKMITGDLVPTSTGLCWENEFGKIIPSIECGSQSQAMRSMRMGTLLATCSGQSIDPFSTVYWDTKSTTAPTAAEPATDTLTVPATMAPPRMPLQPRSNNTLDQMLLRPDQNGKCTTSSPAATQMSKPGRKAAPKVLSKEDLDELKGFVVGNQATKADLLKELKNRFPKHTNETIKTMLGDHFAQMGASKADKKWVYVETS